MAEQTSNSEKDPLLIRWSDTTRFIRQLSHDLRNDLNAIELQSAYLSELATDEELKSEIKRLREIISRLAASLQGLSRLVGDVTPNRIAYPAADFIEDFRSHIERDLPKESAEISWDVHVGDAILNIDPQLLQETFAELVANAFRHDRGQGPLIATAKLENNAFLFALQEPKTRFGSSLENWGREPLRSIGHRHYGLGLNRARAIVEAHGGELLAEYDQSISALITRVRLPTSPPSGKCT
jgi:two-component system, OmpR family, sensor histidine kinase BaeS